MKILKNFIELLILVLFLCVVYINKEFIIAFVFEKLVYSDAFTIEVQNSYFNNESYNFVEVTDDFVAKEKQDILDIFYTGINSGYDEFFFYCHTTYEDCIYDLNNYINDTAYDNINISILNNYIHPFNTFSTLHISSNSLGKVTVTIDKVYTEEEIDVINNKVDEIYTSIISDDMDIELKIKTIHDYIINNTTYDIDRAEFYTSNNFYLHESNTAYGALVEGYSICGGYTDAMYLFLEKLNVNHIKISSEKHIWNYVEIDDIYYHLDLTWDDPVTSNGSNMLQYTFLLITDEELKSLDTGEHDYGYIDVELFNNA